MYVFIILFFIIINKVEAFETKSYNNNFYIGFSDIFYSDFSKSSLEESGNKNGTFYNIGYLYNFDSFYLGASVGLFDNNYIYYKPEVSNEDYMNIHQNMLFSLVTKVPVFKFENIRFLVGASVGYLINKVSLYYVSIDKELVTEYSQQELSVGTIITDNIINKCNEGILGTNLEYEFDIESYVVTGDGVFCNISNEVEVDTRKNNTDSFMSSSLPISLDMTVLYGINKQVDLGIVLGLTMVNDININYSNQYIQLKSDNIYSNYNIRLLVNFIL